MTTRLWRVLALPSTVAVCAALAACGGSSAIKVSDSSFIDKCTSKTTPQINSSSSLTSAQKQAVTSHISEICGCIQQKLEAQGYGNESTDSKNQAFKDAGRTTSQQCTEQALTGGSASSGTDTTSTGASTSGSSGSGGGTTSSTAGSSGNSGSTSTSGGASPAGGSGSSGAGTTTSGNS